MAWLLGRWRSEAGGKAVFPTIPNFTYGEQLDFAIADAPPRGSRALNYSAFAWGINNKEELHSEFGFLAVKDFSRDVALTTTMNNGSLLIPSLPSHTLTGTGTGGGAGFVTVEEGAVGCWGDNSRDFRTCPSHPSIVFHLEDIGRVSFSRDLPVHGVRLLLIPSSPSFPPLSPGCS